MNRRESLKTLVIGSLASNLVLEGCLSEEKKIIYENVWKYKYGRTPNGEHFITLIKHFQINPPYNILVLGLKLIYFILTRTI